MLYWLFRSSYVEMNTGPIFTHFRLVFVFALLVLTTASSTTVASTALQVIGRTTLGDDPRTVNRLNGESFQQDALVTFNGGLP